MVGYKFFFVFLMAIAIISFLIFIYHFMRAFFNRKYKTLRPHWSYLAGPFYFFIPQLFTDKGNYHRKKALPFFLIYLLCFVLMILISSYYEQQ